MRRLIIGVLICFLPLQPSLAMGESSESAFEKKVQRIHEEAIIIDTHVDIPLAFATDKFDPGKRQNQQVDLVKMEEGRMDAAFFVVYVPQMKRDAAGYEEARRQALTKFSAIRRMANDMYPDQIELALTADDVRRQHEAGKKSALIGIENGFIMGKDIGRMQEYYDLGARYMSLTHNGHNDLGDSSAALTTLNDVEVEHGGLSALGEQVVKEMNRLGMIIDVAHAGKSTILDIAELTKAPIISSHHALKSFVDIPRNLDDEELMAIKETGGVVQVVAFDRYVKELQAEAQAQRVALRQEYGIDSFAAFQALSPAQKDEYMRRNALLGATVSDFVDHIDYAVELIGIDHVGIASDFEGGGGVAGWLDASETVNVTRELVTRGYSEKDIKKIWGGNILRVLKETERVAAKLQ